MEDDSEFSWLTNQNSLYNYLELDTSTQSTKDSLLTKLRLLDCSAQLITKFNQQNDVYLNSKKEFKVFTTLDEKPLKVGESCRLSMDIYTYNQQDIPSFFVDGKEITSDTFSMIATCEGTKPCHRTLHYQIDSFLGKDTIINQTVYYTVLPKP